MLQRPLVRRPNVDARHKPRHRLAVLATNRALSLQLDELRIPRRAQTPAVARPNAGEHELRDGLVERVPDRRRDSEELLGRLDADGVPARVVRTGGAVAVPVEAGADAAAVDVSAAATELCPEHVSCRLARAGLFRESRRRRAEQGWLRNL